MLIVVSPGFASSGATANSERPTLSPVSNSASAAATFIGWRSYMLRMNSSPMRKTSSVAGTAIAAPTLAARVNAATSCPRRMWNAQTPSTNRLAVTAAAVAVWKNASSAVSLNRTAKTFVICAWPSTIS